MWNVGRAIGRLDKSHPNPAVGVERFPERKRRRYVTTTEMPRVLTAIEAEEDVFARNAMLLLLLTGARTKEILNAKWRDIDWVQMTLFVGLTKNGEPVLVALSEAAIGRLRELPRIDGNEYIFCGSKSGRPLSGLQSQWQRVRAAADVPDLRKHDLRRTVGSWLIQNGASLQLVGEVLIRKTRRLRRDTRTSKLKTDYEQ
jgi:integrase